MEQPAVVSDLGTESRVRCAPPPTQGNGIALPKSETESADMNGVNSRARLPTFDKRPNLQGGIP
jgi:hypothetical protein